MSNIYLEVTEGIVTNHWNYPAGDTPKGLVKAPEEYALGWAYEDGIFSAPIITYAELRAEAYPTLEDQADMQFHDAVDGTTTWVDAINDIKARFPK
jgi:hypothetical protein